jgi:thiosulfate/3-mercaptopyruvate sulfurtransferase
VKLVDSHSHKFLPIAELQQIFSSITETKKPIITYCGGGIAATSDAFVLTALLGHDDVAVYDGSLSEWVLDPARPMEV